MSADPLGVKCPRCHAAPGTPCYTAGTHKDRRRWAEDDAAVQRLIEQNRPSTDGCQCRNHLGHPKAQYRTAIAAVAWAARGKRGTRGLRMEPYRCPTSECWHIRTARARSAA